MKNWSGYIEWQPSHIFYPKSEGEIQKVVQRAATEQKKIRIIGSGHSFTPLIKTEDFLISLDHYQGLVAVDNATNQVTVRAGTKLFQLNELLDAQGLAMINMGDINVQSVAGALMTGTHGTGSEFGILSSLITAAKFINGKGEIIACSKQDKPELFKALQVSLGTLGIVTEITLICMPSYHLELKIDKQRLDDVLTNIEYHNFNNRHFEFYWFVNTPYVQTKRINITDRSAEKSSVSAFFQEIVLENVGLKAVCELSRLFPNSSNRLSKIAASTTSHVEKVYKSYEAFSTKRWVRFNEMEYSVPTTAYVQVMKELANWVNKHNRRVVFPMENRFVKGDHIPLSPAYGRDSAYIAIHVYNKKEFQPYFKELEDILLAHNGRPHWGKWHNLKHKDLNDVYPMFDMFLRHRAEQDPDELFLSSYMRLLFE